MAQATSPQPSPVGALAQLRAANPTVRMLLGCDLGFNLGFYMLVPFLAGHLTSLAVSGWLVGLILGLRNLSQQGLYLVGGTLADRGEYRSLIVLGCLARSAAFALFGLSQSVPALAVASVLTGGAAALFTPAMKAYLSGLQREERPAAFALSAMLSQAGALLGPLLGMGVLGSDFRRLAFTASALFLLWAVLLRRYLPEQRGTEAGTREPVWRGWREVLAHRDFVIFAVAMAGYAVLFNQLYLALPLTLESARQGARGVGLVFILSGVLMVLLQVRVTAFCRARWTAGSAIVRGLGLMGVAFLPLAVLAASGPRPPSLVTAAVLTTTAVLTLGMMVAFPFSMDMISQLAGERRLGTYYGVYYLAAGLGAALGNLALGHLLERGGLTPWLVLTGVGLTSSTMVAALGARGRLVPGTVAKREQRA
jgi:MFS family permease